MLVKMDFLPSSLTKLTLIIRIIKLEHCSQSKSTELLETIKGIEIVYGGIMKIMKEVNDLLLKIHSKKPFLALIIKAKASILLLPKYMPKMCFFGLLVILN
jgi:hypothetical protein